MTAILLLAAVLPVFWPVSPVTSPPPPAGAPGDERPAAAWGGMPTGDSPAGHPHHQGCTCAANDRPLKLADPPLQGDDVREVQEILHELGYFPQEPSGRYDRATEDAIRRFQAERGLTPDGIVGAETWLHLLSAYDPTQLVIPELLDLPPVSTLPDQFVVIDTGQLTLTLYRQGRLFRRYTVAIGKPDSPTPLGEWQVIHKAKHWGGGFGSRWLGLNIPWGTYGIHGTNRPDLVGSQVSAGCIRMQNWSVEELYELVPEGTRVYIVGPVPVRSSIYPGEAGTDVLEVQRSLAALGLYQGKPDGFFGPRTTAALKEFQSRLRIDEGGRIGPHTLEALGLH